MTIQTLRTVCCDFSGCTRSAPEPKMFEVPDGWGTSGHTHGCPEHADSIAAHKATIDSFGKGDPYRDPSIYVLRCSCGWEPTPPRQGHSSQRLVADHLDHVRAVTADVAATR